MVQVAHLHERDVGVVQIVVIRVSVAADCAQVDRGERNGTLGIDPRTGNVVLGCGRAYAVAGTTAAVRRETQPLKQIVGRAVLLEDDHHVRKIVVWRWERGGGADSASATAVHAQEKSDGTKKQD